MKRVDTKEVKRRSRELTAYIESYMPHGALLGSEQRVWVTDIAKDGTSLVGHTKSYVQVLLPGGAEQRARLMGKSATVRIKSTHRWYLVGEVLQVFERTSVRSGLADIARHVIQRILNPRFLSQWHPMTWRAVSDEGRANFARHVIDTHLNPCFLR